MTTCGEDYKVEYLFWTDLNRSNPSKPPMNTSFVTKLKQNSNFIDCNHIDPYFIIDNTHPFSEEDMARKLDSGCYKQIKKHYYGGIIRLCVNNNLALGINPRYVNRVAHTCDLLVVAVEERDHKTAQYDPINFENKRIAAFVCINFIRKNIFEIDIIGSRNNHHGAGGHLIKNLCLNGKQAGLKYCWLNSVPTAVWFYLRMGFTYLGHAVTSSESKGFMIYDLDEFKENTPTTIKPIKQANNSANIKAHLNKGEPSIEEIKMEIVTKQPLDIIPDVNALVDELSTSEKTQKKLVDREWRQVDPETGARYIKSGFFNSIPRLREIIVLERVFAPQIVDVPLNTQKKKSKTTQKGPRPPPGIPPASSRVYPPTNKYLNSLGITSFRKKSTQRTYAHLF